MSLAGLALAALLGPPGGPSAPLADEAQAPPATRPFEAGDISIGEPIPLPFARAKAAAEAAGQEAAATLSGSAGAGSGWLGITVAESKVPGRWIVDELAPNGPAIAAGINPGDEVRAIGGLPLRNADDVAQALTSIAPGQVVNLAIGRGEQVSDVTLTAVPRPTGLAKSPQSLARADALPSSTEPTALAALPPAAAAAPTVVSGPVTPTPLATLPPASTVAPPASVTTTAAVPATPPAPAFAAAPPVVTGIPAAAEPSAAPRFSRVPAAGAPPATPSEPFSPAPTLAAAEPSSSVAQSVEVAQSPSVKQSLPAPAGRIALGVRTIPIDHGLQARFNLPAAAGAYVIGVVGDLPASRAGVPPGSVIVALDERPVRSPDELTRLVTNGPVGKPVPLEYVLPGGTSRRAEVVLQALEQPLEEALVGPVTPTPAPQFQPQPTPTRAERPASAGDADLLRAAIRRLEARLESLERRLQDR